MKRDERKDLLKLADAFFENLYYDGSCAFGSIGVDCKRPFGNSNVIGDILKIIEWASDDNADDYSDEQKDYVRNLYCNKLVPYLKKKWAEIKDAELITSY